MRLVLRSFKLNENKQNPQKNKGANVAGKDRNFISPDLLDNLLARWIIEILSCCTIVPTDD